MVLSSIVPDIRLFLVPVSGIRPDTEYKKGRNIRPDTGIWCIPSKN
jgi:hypothetical protein